MAKVRTEKPGRSPRGPEVDAAGADRSVGSLSASTRSDSHGVQCDRRPARATVAVHSNSKRKQPSGFTRRGLFPWSTQSEKRQRR